MVMSQKLETSVNAPIEAVGKPIRILLADDHTLVRAGIRSLVESIGGVDVVGETGDGAALWAATV